MRNKKLKRNLKPVYRIAGPSKIFYSRERIDAAKRKAERIFKTNDLVYIFRGQEDAPRLIRLNGQWTKLEIE